MNIQNINNYIYLQTFNSRNLLQKRTGSKPDDTHTNLQKDTKIPQQATSLGIENSTAIAASQKKEEIFFKTFLRKKGKVTKEEYDDIIKNHPSALVKAQKHIERYHITSTTPETIAKAAICLKKHYDESYKEGYIIISVGTSPSAITETMQALGCRVIFLPVSGLRDMPEPKKEELEKYIEETNLKYLPKYLEQHGVNQENNDFIILLDYFLSGRSLNYLATFFTEMNTCQKDKLSADSILGYLELYTSPNKEDGIFLTEEEYVMLENNMCDEDIFKLSNTPHFYMDKDYNGWNRSCIASSDKSEKELFKEFDDFSQPLARAFALCSIHEAMKLIKET
ncbi:MAG: hypothetical protein IKU37_08025 [Candidatus Gastranaerophilales bacterium]|nr:hypothetical protein [Candidatus Gastranaerophilales bacterium]